VGKKVRLAEPLESNSQVNIMESGLTHCADSMAGGRGGEYIQRLGAPIDPTEKSPGVKSGYFGAAPNLNKKFLRKEQR
jgi:hypothetical protein